MRGGARGVSRFHTWTNRGCARSSTRVPRPVATTLAMERALSSRTGVAGRFRSQMCVPRLPLVTTRVPEATNAANVASVFASTTGATATVSVLHTYTPPEPKTPSRRRRSGLYSSICTSAPDGADARCDSVRATTESDRSARSHTRSTPRASTVTTCRPSGRMMACFTSSACGSTRCRTRTLSTSHMSTACVAFTSRGAG